MFDADLFTVLMARSNMYSCQQTDALLEKKADLDENGMVPVNELPTSIFERMIVVENDTARFALTTSEVQNGDVVYVNDTMIMYFVIDDTKLDQEAGYREFAAGIAAKAIGDKNGNDITTTYQTIINNNNKLSADLVDDSNSTNKFNMQADWNQTDNTSGDYIKNKPTLGTAAAKDVPVSGNASTTQVVMGDDSRLTDSRTPIAHNQASDTINAMTGYTAPVNPTTWQTVSASDTLNAATQKIVNNEELNKSNILSIQAFTNNASIDSDRKLYISATEPTGDIPANSTWINGATIKAYHISNNLFNKDDSSIIKPWYIYNASPNDIRESQAGSKSIIIKCAPNTTYTFSFPTEPSNMLIRLIDTPNSPEVGDNGNNFASQYGGSSITYTTSSTAQYITAFLWDANIHPDMTVEAFLADIMVNMGSTALPYEPYGNTWQ